MAGGSPGPAHDGLTQVGIGLIWYNIGPSKGRFSHKAMKKASRALFLVAAALCAVVLGRVANKGLRSGLPEAYAGESRAPIVSAVRSVSGVVTMVSDGMYGKMKFWWKAAKDERGLVVRCFVSPKKQMAVCTLLHTKGDGVRAEYLNPNDKR